MALGVAAAGALPAGGAQVADGGEVTSADIARIAGVGRAAVSNWRRRHPDFPRPVGGPATSPTFSLDEVQEWLESNGRTASSAAERRADQFADESLADSIAGLFEFVLPGFRTGVVLDPATGDGQVLRAVAARLGSRPTYVGQDADGAGGYPVGHPLGDDALAAYRQSADVVVCAPPQAPVNGALTDHLWEFGAPSTAGDFGLIWCQLAFEYVRPGGTAIVLVPYMAAVKGAGRRIRAEMLRSGVLRQVIALPQRMMRATGMPLQIWVLQRPVSRPTYTVVMVDLSDTDRSQLPMDPDGWQAVFDDMARCREVPAIELLDDDVLYVPAAHISPPRRDYRTELTARAARYRAALSAVPDAAPKFASTSDPSGFATTTIADLARLGALHFPDRHGPLERGDIVISADPNRFDATVVEGDEPPMRRAEVIRCDTDQLDPYFIACFLGSEANRRQAAGTLGGTFRLDLRRARIPRMPLDEQRRYAQAYRQIVDFAGRADATAATAADLAQTAIDGLTAGALLPQTRPTR
jgi:hypothetical protein